MKIMNQRCIVLISLVYAFFVVKPMEIRAQTIVWDPAVHTQLITNHLIQNGNLEDIKTSEGKIATAQSIITLKMEEIKRIEDKIYGSLKDVQIVIHNVKDIAYAYEISQDIGKYQKQMVDLAKKDPELLIVAVQAEIELLNKGVDLLQYIFIAVTATDANLMNNAQRVNLIRNVIDQLRLMRGMAYSIVRQMRYVAMNGILNSFNPLGFQFARDKKLVKEILNEFKKR
jgi:hypothetical protein